MPSNSQPTSLVRAIGRWSLVALVINSIIGSGIFGLPSPVAGLVAGASPLAYLAAAVVMGFIVACYAEVASRFTGAGGAYLYAREAFGRFAGIEIGWLSWLVRLTAAAAAADLFVVYLSQFWPQAKLELQRMFVLTLLVGFIAAVNYRGVSGGANLSNFFTVTKLIPLLVFVGVGVFFAHPGSLAVRARATSGDWLEAVLLAVFAYGGFEGALMPMGEAKDPRRDTPFALLVALGSVTVIYTLVQYVVVGVLPSAAQTDRPLAAAATVFLGRPGAALMALGTMVSVYGYLSAMILNVPRLTYALAEQKDFPRFFAAIHPRFHTPHVSIAIFAALVLVLAVAGTFRWNVLLSSVARLVTYGSTCAALLALRRKQPRGETFHLKAGSLCAWAGMALGLVLLTRLSRGELAIIVVTVAIAGANWVWARRQATGPLVE